MALNRTGLMMAAMMALSGTALAEAPPRSRQKRELTPAEKEAQIRRELADCQAHKTRLAAAAEKRARKAAKRIKDMPSNAKFNGGREGA